MRWVSLVMPPSDLQPGPQAVETAEPSDQGANLPAMPGTVTPAAPASEHQPSRLHTVTRTRGVNPLLYWFVRGILQPFFHLYFRMTRIGREHIPAEGPVIVAANHRSFLDPFIIGTMARRPMYYVAKKELFRHRFTNWLLTGVGAFPIDRGAADADAMGTAREVLERGDILLIFPEGTRIRPGGLADPKRGVGRLALETGAPVVPVAIIGTENVRKGWRVRPHKIRTRAGAPIRFPKVDQPSAELAGAVTDRVWPCVELQWQWLGGEARPQLMAAEEDRPPQQQRFVRGG